MIEKNKNVAIVEKTLYYLLMPRVHLRPISAPITSLAVVNVVRC